MIQNERQYRISQAQAQNFRVALQRIEAATDLHPLLKQAQLDATQSQYLELLEQIEEYETLREKSPTTLVLNSIDELPVALIKARIALGMSQKALAEKLGLKEQQIQRYEATHYQTANISRLMEITKALGLEIRGEIIFN